jgi:hypothetical protein
LAPMRTASMKSGAAPQTDAGGLAGRWTGKSQR